VIEQHNLEGIVVSQESSQQIDFVPRAVGLEEPLRWIFEWEEDVVEVDIDAGFKAR
jgi:Ni,Fe-hydrogenase III large subunit